MSRSGLIDLSEVLVHETDKAVLVDHGEAKPTWVPKSLCEIERDPSGKTWTLTQTERIATEKGLI